MGPQKTATTPTVAIIYATGCLYTTQRIHQRQLLYLKTLLNRPENDWPRIHLHLQKTEGIWWAKQIDGILEQYNLDYSWEQIRNMTVPDWKRRVQIRIEEKHKETLIDECNGAHGEKQKRKAPSRTKC